MRIQGNEARSSFRRAGADPPVSRAEFQESRSAMPMKTRRWLVARVSPGWPWPASWSRARRQWSGSAAGRPRPGPGTRTGPGAAAGSSPSRSRRASRARRAASCSTRPGATSSAVTSVPVHWVARFLADGTLDPELRLGRSGLGRARHRRRLRRGRTADGRQGGRGRLDHGGRLGRLTRRADDRGRRGRPDLPQRWHLHPGLRRHGSARRGQMQLNGSIVVGGTTGTQGVVARLTPTGGLDPTFHGDGARTDLPLTVEAPGAAGRRQDRDRRAPAGKDFALMRLNPDGTTDASFGARTASSTTSAATTP